MWCFEIRNIKTGEVRLAFGYDWKDACKREGLMNPDEWRIDNADYED